MNAPYHEVHQYLKSRQFVLDEQRYVSERDEYEPRDSEGYRRFDVRYMFARNTPIHYSYDSVTVYAHVKTKSHLGPYAEPYEVYRMILSTAEGRYEIIESDDMRYWKDTLNRRLP
ncbi:MAG: hypothetical protein IJV02_04055, partial [Candidatus Methanomethylophilaceae archaeon]|nr:hypothetical protein [Candidatus Methanomethylophilaceae archaeon]